MQSDLAVVLLAAGQSRRFGEHDKLLTLLEGREIVRHVAEAIGVLAPRWKLAVCPSADGALVELLRSMEFEIAVNQCSGEGISTSVVTGIAQAAKTSAAAAMICLGDMPFVTARHLRKLQARFDAETAPAVGSMSNGKRTPPAIFARTLFGQLMKLRGDRGAGSLLAHSPCVAAPARMLVDIDLPSDL